MKSAVRKVLVEGASKKRAAREFGLPRGTLQRHIKKAEQGLGVEKKLGRRCVLTSAQEEDLVQRLIDMESRLYGLTTEDVRRIVYQFCDQHGISHTFSHETQLAGRKWLNGFFRRHKELSVRLPERTSISRALGFNKPKVKLFFDILGQTLFDQNSKRLIPPESVYNVDETGFTICQKSQRIVAKRGKKNIGILSSAEKGKNVTVVCCVSASGYYVPPMFVYPRVRVRLEFLDRGPVGAIARANKSGWITEELFLEWFQHFIDHVQPKSRQQPTLLLADGHSSHTSLSLINKARENNVILLIFPSHCTHRLQPLDVGVYRSMKFYYDRAVRYLFFKYWRLLPWPWTIVSKSKKQGIVFGLSILKFLVMCNMCLGIWYMSRRRLHSLLQEQPYLGGVNRVLNLIKTLRLCSLQY